MSDKTATSDLSSIAAEPLDMTRPVASQIFDRLKSAILKTTLQPGCLVSEAEIGHVLGASRTPVREALTQLRNDGLIETRPSRGNYVTKLSEDQIRDAQFIREALELAVVRALCHDGMPEASLVALDTALSLQDRAIRDRDPIQFQAQDDRFHSLLAAATGRGRAATLLIREKAVLDRLRVLSLGHADRMGELLEEHRRILSAIRARDVTAAGEAMRRHLQSVLRDLSDLKRANRAYFN